MGVRIARTSDAEAVAAIYAPFVTDTTISFEDIPPSPAGMAERISTTLTTHPYLVFEEPGEGVIGFAYGSVHRARAAYRWSVDVSAYVANGRHGRGVGRALYAELLGLLSRQGFHAAFAGIALPNDKSVGLHEAMGFSYLGAYREVGFKHGAWRDVGWWSRALRDGAPSGDPTPFSALAPIG